MGNHPSKTSSPLVYDPKRIEICQSSTPEPLSGQSTLTFWECTTCGQRYVVPVATNLFIPPPPTTECIVIKTDEKWTHANGEVVGISITGGATCDYVRVNRVVGEPDLREQIAEPGEAASAMEIPAVNELSARACDKAFMKVEGEHGRVSRQNPAVDTACDEDDAEDCEFWNAQCKDIDCIYEGEHCRHQCAIAELDEEPKAMVAALKRGLGFLRSAT